MPTCSTTWRKPSIWPPGASTGTDRWFTSKLLAPEEDGDAADTVAYDFNEHNVKGFGRQGAAGQEAPPGR